jgi:hypothetical protein
MVGGKRICQSVIKGSITEANLANIIFGMGIKFQMVPQPMGLYQ